MKLRWYFKRVVERRYDEAEGWYTTDWPKYVLQSSEDGVVWEDVAFVSPSEEEFANHGGKS